MHYSTPKELYNHINHKHRRRKQVMSGVLKLKSELADLSLVNFSDMATGGPEVAFGRLQKTNKREIGQLL